MTTLQFRVANNRFACDFDVERQNTVTLDPRTETHKYFHVIWKIDYSMQVSVDNAALRPVADLGHREWLEFDALVLGLLVDWPTRADETRWIDEDGRNDRVIFSLGSGLSGIWDRDFARTLDKKWTQPSAARFRGQSSDGVYRERLDSIEWKRTNGAREIVNASTGWKLQYEGSYQTFGRQAQEFRFFLRSSGLRSYHPCTCARL